MDQVITFNKSLVQRNDEFLDVLGGNASLPVSAIKREWGFYLELIVDPCGWQAIWKIQRKTCESLNITYPSTVLVLVLSIDTGELSALVKILGAQEDIHIPGKHNVPLKQLWPLKQQDKTTILNLEATANALDMLRCFYNHIIMPWDYDDDESTDWVSEHLKSRLKLYYDMINGTIPREVAEHLHALVTEAKRLEVRKHELEVDMEDIDDVHERMLEENATVQALMELHVRMLEIKAEVDILENPVLRTAVIRKHKQLKLITDESIQNTWVIMSEGTAANSIEFLSRIQQLYPQNLLKFRSFLTLALEQSNANDTCILGEAIHSISLLGALEHGGVLKGISSKENTILTSNTEDVMLDLRRNTLLLENLTIDATSAQCAIMVRAGQLTLLNCKLIGDGKSSTHQGIIVLNGAKLIVSKCEITNFSIGIVGNSGSIITIEESEIFDCTYGLKVFDNCVLTAIKTTVRNCMKYGVCVETENNFDKNDLHVGDFDILNM